MIGEITLVIQGIKVTKLENVFNKLEIKKELFELTKGGMSLSSASKYLAKKNHVKKNVIYDLY